MKPQVVAVGGGHGLAATIRAVRRYATRTTAVVATADDGGSTGRLRTTLPLPAPGDIRKCLAAMAERPGVASPLPPLIGALDHRFGGTDVEGHALGNLLLAGLTAVTGDFVAAVDETARLLGIEPEVARVLPATAVPVVLRASTADGREVGGQVAISGTVGIARIHLAPAGTPAPADAVDALVDADQVVLGPGSLYTSVLAAVVVDDIREALADSRARRVYVCNVRAELGETRGYDVAAHVDALRRHGVEPDVVVTQAGALPLGALAAGVEVVEADVVRPHGLAHDGAKLAAVLADLVP